MIPSKKQSCSLTLLWPQNNIGGMIICAKHGHDCDVANKIMETVKTTTVSVELYYTNYVSLHFDV
jgi:hypothetical protein